MYELNEVVTIRPSLNLIYAGMLGVLLSFMPRISFATNGPGQTNPGISISTTPTSSGNLVKVSGIVVGNEDGTPLPGVNVVIQGTSRTDVTGVDGRFSFDNVPVGAVLSFSFIGYHDQVAVVDSDKPLRIYLEPAAEQLTEVVVVVGAIMRTPDDSASHSNLWQRIKATFRKHH